MFCPSRINNESTIGLLRLFVIFSRKRMAFNYQLADRSNRHETVMIIPVNNPTMDTNLMANIQRVLALDHTTMDMRDNRSFRRSIAVDKIDVGP